MRLLQRYILIELLRVFFSLLTILTILLVFVGVFREVTESGLGPLQALQILPYIVPSLLPFTIPSTLLLTVCVVYGRIAGDNEITAAKAAGINVMSLIAPALILGVLLSIGSLVLTDRVIPWAVANIQRTVTEAMEDIFLDMLRTNQQVTDKKLGLSISVIDVEDRTLIMPTFKYAPNGGSEITLQAQKANLEFDLDNQQIILHLVHGYIDIPGQQRVWFEKEDKPFPMPNQSTETKARHMSITTINKQMFSMARNHDQNVKHRDVEMSLALLLGEFDKFHEMEMRSGDDPPVAEKSLNIKLHTEIHSRYAMATSCFFFVLLGSPFSILQAKRQFLTSFMLCFVPILLIYYPLTLGMMNLSKTGTINPAWGMWTGNLLLATCACYVLNKVLKH